MIVVIMKMVVAMMRVVVVCSYEYGDSKYGIFVSMKLQPLCLTGGSCAVVRNILAQTLLFFICRNHPSIPGLFQFQVNKKHRIFRTFLTCSPFIHNSFIPIFKFINPRPIRRC